MKPTNFPTPRRFPGRPKVADWMAASDVAEALHIRPSWFYKLRRSGRMPLTGHPVESFTYFDAREVRSMVKKIEARGD